jgi:hypothetical protein
MSLIKHSLSLALERSRVRSKFYSVPGFSKPEPIVHVSQVPNILRFIGAGGGDPFYAVIARKVA